MVFLSHELSFYQLNWSNQDQYARSDVLHFDFIFVGFHTSTASLTSIERYLVCIFLWIKSVHLHFQMHTLVCDKNKATTLQ